MKWRINSQCTSMHKIMQLKKCSSSFNIHHCLTGSQHCLCNTKGDLISQGGKWSNNQVKETQNKTVWYDKKPSHHVITWGGIITKVKTKVTIDQMTRNKSTWIAKWADLHDCSNLRRETNWAVLIHKSLATTIQGK